MKYIAVFAVVLTAVLLRWDIRVIQVHSGESVYLVKHDRWTGKVYRCEDIDSGDVCVEIG